MVNVSPFVRSSFIPAVMETLWTIPNICSRLLTTPLWSTNVKPTYSVGAFADKLFFKPIDHDAFLALYRPLLGMLDPQMVLFAIDAMGDIAGFLFGLPDRANDAAVLKTYASRRRGVGHLLAHRFHADAKAAGFAHVVHALMHVDNISLDRSAQHRGTVFRRYALFGCRLTR